MAACLLARCTVRKSRFQHASNSYSTNGGISLIPDSFLYLLLPINVHILLKLPYLRLLTSSRDEIVEVRVGCHFALSINKKKNCFSLFSLPQNSVAMSIYLYLVLKYGIFLNSCFLNTSLSPLLSRCMYCILISFILAVAMCNKNVNI